MWLWINLRLIAFCQLCYPTTSLTCLITLIIMICLTLRLVRTPSSEIYIRGLRVYLPEDRLITRYLMLSSRQVSPGESGAVMKYGFPSLSNIKTRESYVISYDPRTRTASWVIERLNPASLSGSSNRKYCEFKEDNRWDISSLSP